MHASGDDAIWEVVGGIDKGGILVRVQQDLSSPQEPARLSTGAHVLELELVGERLHYKLLVGKGPPSGWVSLKLKSKDLLVRVEKQVSEPKPKPQFQWRPLNYGAAARVQAPVAVDTSSSDEEIPELQDEDESHNSITSEIRSLCEKHGIDVELLQSPGNAPKLIDELERLERRSISELRAEIKKRHFAASAGVKKPDLAALLKQILVWDELHENALQYICEQFGLTVVGDANHSDLMQLLADATWEARGIPIRRLSSLTVGYGILDQIDRFYVKSEPDLAQQCEKRGLPTEPYEKDILLSRLRTLLVWQSFPLLELQAECKQYGLQTDEMKAAESDETSSVYSRHRNAHQARDALLQRLIELMWAVSKEEEKISRYFQMMELPTTATLHDLKMSYKKLALRHHPDKNQNSGQQDFQLVQEAYEALTAHIQERDGVKPATREQDGTVTSGSAIFLARHGERLDDVQMARGIAWVQSADKPWDPPLTANGKLQAAALGRAAVQHAKRLGIPRITRIFVSPFIRCFQTGVEVAKEVGLDSVCVEPSLAESLGEHFYRSWCVPTADGTWGGPKDCGIGVHVDRQNIRVDALFPASELLPYERYSEAADSFLDTTYAPYLPLEKLDYKWAHFETDEQFSKRMRRFLDFASESYSQDCVMFISHGGPLQSLYEDVFPNSPSELPGYCGLYAFLKKDGKWKSPLVADMEHMRRWCRPRPQAKKPFQSFRLLPKPKPRQQT